MDSQLLIYIAFVVIALITRVIKANKKKAEEQQRQRSVGAEGQPPKKQPVSFEDLLREFTGEEKAEPQREVVKPHYEREVWEEKTPTRELYEEEAEEISDADIQRIYEESIKDAKTMVPVADRVDRSKTMERSEHFKSYDTEEEEPNDFLESLHDVDGLKRAIILSEVIGRKY